LSTYVDTSFFVSLYISDRHSAEAQRRMIANPEIWLTPLHHAEYVHAIEQHVFRKDMSSNDSAVLHNRFRKHAESGVWTEVPFPELAYSRCSELARQFTAKLGMRTLDTLHVASALELRVSRFWTFDQRQEALARAVGLRTN
jgi:predicted nucleic acid-binding protein